MFIPIGVDNPLSRIPYANCAIIAVCVVVFLIGLPRDETDKAIVIKGGIWGGKPVDMTVAEVLGIPDHPEAADLLRMKIPQNATRLHQFVTHAFIHIDFLHLLGNMIFLFVFGNNLNDVLGHGKYLMVYIGIAVVGALGHVVQYHAQSPAIVAVGASGAISGLVGMYLILFPRNDVKILYFITIVPRTFMISSIWCIALWAGVDIYWAFSGGGGQVAYWIHVVGYVVGASLAIFLLKMGWIDVGGWDIFSWMKEGRRKGARIVGRQQVPQMTAHRGGMAPPELSLPTESAEEYRSSIGALLSRNEVASALGCYDDFVAAYPDSVLDERTQVMIGVQFARMKRRNKAVAALLAYMDAYPEGSLRDQASLNLGILLAANPLHMAAAKAHLENALRLTTNPKIKQMAETKLAQLGAF